jgi:CheY-like chemotaxis protein
MPRKVASAPRTTMDEPRASLPKRVLVYDDNDAFAYAIQVVLRDAGYEVHVAVHFEIALKLLEQQPIDLLIADLFVPGGVNGIAMAQMARMKQAAIRIIFCTGYDLEETTQPDLGVILRKPVSGDLLLSEVRKAIG